MNFKVFMEATTYEPTIRLMLMRNDVIKVGKFLFV